jgi:hypothetical protein
MLPLKSCLALRPFANKPEGEMGSHFLENSLLIIAILSLSGNDKSQGYSKKSSSIIY